MVEGIQRQALALGMMNKTDWDRGIRGLHESASPDGTFCYTFFKGIGWKRG
jgi:hypothetical protein